MAVSLSKGQKVDLTKGNPGLNNLLIDGIPISMMEDLILTLMQQHFYLQGMEKLLLTQILYSMVT